MTLEERLTAIEAEYQATRDEADAFKRLAEAQRNALEERADTAPLPLLQEIAWLREQADAASERANELASQMDEIKAHLEQTDVSLSHELAARIRTIKEKLAALEEDPESRAHDLPREAEQQALLRQLQNLREELLGVHAKRLAADYQAAARQLIRAATELKAFADFATIFGVRLHLNFQELRIPPPQSDGTALKSERTETLHINQAEILAAKEAITAQWADLLSD